MGKINSSKASIIFILLAMSFILSCFGHQVQNVQTKGVYHLVKKNETLRMIARAYNVEIKDLARINNITDMNSIKEGSAIFIPDATKAIDNIRPNVKTVETAANVKDKRYGSDDEKNPAKNKDVEKEKTLTKAPIITYEEEPLSEDMEQEPKQKQSMIAIREETEPAKNIPEKKLSDEKNKSVREAQKPEEKIQIEKNKFVWPVRGTVKTNFGIQPDKTYHNWIKIVSSADAKVKAAAAGTVIFSSNLKNYGETIIIRHKRNFATVYTHLKKRVVRIDQAVKKGEAIATLGEKDDAGETYMNFEVRFQGKARDPLPFLL